MDDFRLYHRVPAYLEGGELRPLNQLKVLSPKIAEMHARIYKGREELMLRTIPGRTWLWNDVIHFSTVHPKRVVEALTYCGFSKKVKSRWFAVDPIKCNFNSSNSIIFLHNKARLPGESFETSEFEQYSLQACQKHTEVPVITKQYFDSVISQGGNPLMFGGIPHVLHYGSLKIEDLDIIELSS